MTLYCTEVICCQKVMLSPHILIFLYPDLILYSYIYTLFKVGLVKMARYDTMLKERKNRHSMFLKIFKFQPTREWVNRVKLSSFQFKNFYKFCACLISTQKAEHLDVTTMFTYSHSNTPVGQISERTYYLSYFLNPGQSLHFKVVTFK